MRFLLTLVFWPILLPIRIIKAFFTLLGWFVIGRAIDHTFCGRD